MKGSLIKSTRKALGINQIDLAGEELSRNQLSYIENDKTSLTPRTTKHIHYNMHLFAWLLDQSIDFEFDELLGGNPDYHFFRKAQETLKKLEADTVYSIAELHGVFELYAYAPIGFLKIPLLILTAEKLEDYKEQNFVADIYEKVLDEYRNLNLPKEYHPYRKIRLVINKLVLYYNSSMQHRKMIDLIQYWRSELIKNGAEISSGIYFNLALAYSKMGSYEQSHKSIELFIELEDKNIEDTINAFTIKGNTYFRDSKFIEALVWYQKAMKLSKAEGLKGEYALALSNLVNAYVSDQNEVIEHTFIEAYSDLLRLDTKTIGSNATSFLLYAKAIGSKYFTANLSEEYYNKLLTEAVVYAFNSSPSSFSNIASSVIEKTDNYDLLVKCLDFVLQLEQESFLENTEIMSLLLKLGKKLSRLKKFEHIYIIFDVVNKLKEANYEKVQQTL